MLKLVSDNAEPTGPDYGNVPEMLRQYAAEIEAGQYGEVISVLLLLEFPKGVDWLGCGDEPSPAHMVGMCEMAKIKMIADEISSDDD